MYELDQYRQKYGKNAEFNSKPFQALEETDASLKTRIIGGE